MKRLSVVGLFTALVIGSSSSATAGPIVSVGSTYDIYIAGEVSLNAVDRTITFGTPATFSRAGLTVSASDSDADLGGGVHDIVVTVSANGDLFPTPNEGAIVGFGTFGDPLDLLGPVYLADARIRLFTADGAIVFTSSNLANDYRANVQDPWDGFFYQFNQDWVVGLAGGAGVSGFSFEFQVTEESAPIPEPTSVLLIGSGLVALARRRARQ